jgi:HK97 family phage major capsid protein
MLLGKPVYTSPYVPDIAAGKPVLLFGDLSYYWIGDRLGRTLQRCDELYTADGMTRKLVAEADVSVTSIQLSQLSKWH